MLPPDSSKKIASWNRQPLTDGSAALSLENCSDVAQIAKALSELAGAAVAVDLALDLVLNEVVEQARLATGATGAAVALARDGEMVCRATTGEHAPELGVRVEAASGLSGDCLRSGEVQHCSDTETDTRVDAEACRRLGIRSVLLMPLNDGNGPFGILEAFSSHPNAFGERDINTLRALAGRIAASKREAEEGSAGPTRSQAVAPVADATPAAVRPSVLDEDELNEDKLDDDRVVHPRREDIPLAAARDRGESQEETRQPASDSPLDAEEAKKSDIWTTVLVILVIAAAVSLGVVIGWRGALQGSVQPARASRGSARPSTSQDPSDGASNPSSANPLANSTAPQSNPTSADEGTERSQAGQQPSPQLRPQASLQPRHPAGESAAGPVPGGLTVTEDGKVIYRLRPKPIPDSATTSRSGSLPDATRLLHRVNPEYPAEAKSKHIQGAVVLNVQVLGNGSVGNVEIAAGDPLLAGAAVRAVKQWKYQPYVVDGQPVQSQTRITIRFSLPSS